MRVPLHQASFLAVIKKEKEKKKKANQIPGTIRKGIVNVKIPPY